MFCNPVSVLWVLFLRFLMESVEYAYCKTYQIAQFPLCLTWVSFVCGICCSAFHWFTKSKGFGCYYFIMERYSVPHGHSVAYLAEWLSHPYRVVHGSQNTNVPKGTEHKLSVHLKDSLELVHFFHIWFTDLSNRQIQLPRGRDNSSMWTVGSPVRWRESLESSYWTGVN